MQQPVVSVIIPAWNAEKTLENCLRSVMCQTFRDMEIVVVDDGSTDGTWALLQRLKREDPRICAIRQANGGVSAARNTGLAAATGKYIRFVDADDVLPPEAMAELLSTAENQGSDLVLAAYTEVVGALRRVRSLAPGQITLAMDAFLPLMNRRSNSFYYGVLWNKLFRADLICKGQVRFVGGLNWGEDFVFVCDYLAGAEKISYTEAAVYDYQRNAGGMTAHQVRDCLRHPVENIRMKVRLYQALKRLFERRGAYRANRWTLWLYLVRVTLNN